MNSSRSNGVDWPMSAMFAESVRSLPRDDLEERSLDSLDSGAPFRFTIVAEMATPVFRRLGCGAAEPSRLPLEIDSGSRCSGSGSRCSGSGSRCSGSGSRCSGSGSRCSGSGFAVLWLRFAVLWLRFAVPWLRFAVLWLRFAVFWLRFAVLWLRFAVPWLRFAVPCFSSRFRFTLAVFWQGVSQVR